MSIKYLLEKALYRAASVLEGPEINWPKEKKELITSISESLEPLGLFYQASMQWVEKTADASGCRRLFRVHDAGSMRPLTVNWGYSFDFVPHIGGAGVVWHRTFASARPDLWYAPANGAPKAHRSLGQYQYDASVPFMISDGLKRAKILWAEPSSFENIMNRLEAAAWQLHQLPPIVDRYMARRSPFSLPFILARNGSDDAELQLYDVIRSLPLTSAEAVAVREKFEAVKR